MPERVPARPVREVERDLLGVGLGRPRGATLRGGHTTSLSGTNQRAGTLDVDDALRKAAVCLAMWMTLIGRWWT